MYVLATRKLQVGDWSGNAVILKIEYKPAVYGYHIHWLTSKGVSVEYMSSYDWIGIDKLAVH